MNKTETFKLAIALFNNLSKHRQRKVAKAIKNNNWDYTYEWENCVRQAIVMRNTYNQQFEKYGEEIDE